VKEATDIELKRENKRMAKLLYPSITHTELKSLLSLTGVLRLSVSRGEVLCIDGKWYVTHGGLLRIAQRHRCWGIQTVLQRQHSDPLASRWIFKATAYKSRYSRGFSGYGDADPSNVSSLVRGAEMRVAETRAVNHALRGARRPPKRANFSHQFRSRERITLLQRQWPPRLRDQLCLLIRQYNLDANLVKAYAADFCGTANFVALVANWWNPLSRSRTSQTP
jgi:hypothetical protein